MPSYYNPQAYIGGAGNPGLNLQDVLNSISGATKSAKTALAAQSKAKPATGSSTAPATSAGSTAPASTTPAAPASTTPSWYVQDRTGRSNYRFADTTEEGIFKMATLNKKLKSGDKFDDYLVVKGNQGIITPEYELVGAIGGTYNYNDKRFKPRLEVLKRKTAGSSVIELPNTDTANSGNGSTSTTETVPGPYNPPVQDFKFKDQAETQQKYKQEQEAKRAEQFQALLQSLSNMT